jgi:tetratricopeptide (TPR) repeat protein
MVILCIVHYKGIIWERVKVIPETQFQSLQQRTDVWRGTLRLILAHPFGTGIGTFEYIYPSYRINSDRFFVDYAHSDYLQIASELGLLGVGIFIWFILVVLIQAIRNISRQRLPIFYGISCAVCSFILQSLVDFPLGITACAVLFFSVLAMLNSYGFCRKAVIFLNFNTNIVIGVIVIVYTLIFTSIYNADKYFNLAKDYFKKLEWDKSLSYYDAAIKVMPLRAVFFANRGSIFSLKSTLTVGQKKMEYHVEAKSNFLKAISLNRFQSDYYLNLAWLYLDEGNNKDAVYAFNKAIEVNPKDSQAYLSYADYCLEHSLYNEAVSIYHRALSLFLSDDGRFARLYGNIQGLFSKMYKYIHDYELLKKVVPQDKLDVWIAFASFLESEKMYPQAYQEYSEISLRFPQNPTAKIALARLEKLQ